MVTGLSVSFPYVPYTGSQLKAKGEAQYDQESPFQLLLDSHLENLP